MANPLREQLEEAFRKFEHNNDAIATIQQKLQEATTVITSKNRAVAVTVDGHGELSEIKFLNSAYRRMSPSELGALLKETIGQARAEAADNLMAMVTERFPELPFVDALHGGEELSAIMQELARSVTDMWPNAVSQSSANEGRLL